MKQHIKTIFGGIEFVTVPAGKFLMGSSDEDDLAEIWEKPQHVVEIPYDYLIGRFPITNEQYAVFAAAQKITHPLTDWEKIPAVRERLHDHPVCVSWNHATQYCAWLNDLLNDQLPTGAVLRLPTEAEWEKSARGKNGLIYPWGNLFDKDRCNTSEANVGDPTPVGKYSPQGDSPFGCADMSGNEWEWTHSLFVDYPYHPGDGREDEKAQGDRVTRGGSFVFDAAFARCAFRGEGQCGLFDVPSFRVVIAPSIT